ncbi:hypothetical protein K438DRAFT_2014381 [Mycena galopus ATCC 62051]|nr:hypothetical protein K438DRAFT_2014381 [Mycena galopus ATCC 62051]
MAPDKQYTLVPPEHRPPGSEEDHWFLMEKPGLKLAQLTGYEHDMDIDEVEFLALIQNNVALSTEVQTLQCVNDSLVAALSN